MTTELETDILIAGGGFAGLTLALALARGLGPGFSIAVIDREGDRAIGADPRAVALSASTRRMLDTLGVWSAIGASAEPVRRIEITDSSLDTALRPVLLGWDNEVELDGERHSTAAHIVPLPVLTAALTDAVATAPGIRIVKPLELGKFDVSPFHARASGEGPGGTVSVRARLAVAADGRSSFIRRQSGIKVVGWPYAQLGIATTVAHARDHGGVAVQHFLPGGPFAILPLPGRRCCVTWSEKESEGRRIMALDDAAFLEELDLRFGGRLGALTLEGPRRAWPLSMHLARAYCAPRVALVGDAAHGVHPIAGQGLNLAMRDVAALAEVVADAARTGLDFGMSTTLERYERWRRFDSLQAAAAYDAINSLFSREAPLLRSVRELGLQIVDRLPPLKRAFVGEAAGLRGNLPRLLQGELP